MGACGRAEGRGACGVQAVRGHPLFILSMALQYLTPMLRSAAGMSPWQVQLFTTYCKILTRVPLHKYH